MRSMVGLLFACSMVACAADVTATDELPGSDNESVVTSSAKAKSFFIASDLPSLDGTTEDAVTLAQDCVFIQWCDEPPRGGTWTVVGKVRASCRNQCWNDALVNEFVGDAKAVCGAHSLDDNRWRIDCL